MEDKQFLQHFGIAGMKWGRKKSSNSTHQANASQDHLIKEQLKKKPVHEMSNDELRTLNTRIQLEKQHKELTKKPQSMVKKFVNELLVNTGKQALKQVVDANSKKLVDELLKKGVSNGVKKKAHHQAAKTLVKSLTIKK